MKGVYNSDQYLQFLEFMNYVREKKSFYRKFILKISHFLKSEKPMWVQEFHFHIHYLYEIYIHPRQSLF